MTNQKLRAAILIALILIGPAVSSHAVSNVLITIQGTNVVISWPSKPGAGYLIQHRPGFATNTPWLDLVSDYPSASGTNRTSYVLPGLVQSLMAGGGAGAGGNPPPSRTSIQQTQADEQTLYLLDETTRHHITSRRVFPQYIWDQEGRPPLPWELAVRPPYPWEAPPSGGHRRPAVFKTSSESLAGDSLLGEAGDGGFYRIFQQPIWPNSMSNAVVEGLTFTAPDFDGYYDRMVKFQIFVDGTAKNLGILQTRNIGGINYQGVDFWFNELANGTRQLRMVAELRLDDVIGPESASVTLTSLVTSVQVSNLLAFTNWEAVAVGGSTVFEAVSAITNVDWTINVYDVVDDWVVGHSGYSSDGRISWAWNLVDEFGLTRDDLDWDPYFYSKITITPRAGGFTAAAAATKPTPLKVLDYPTKGYWSIVYQDIEKRPGPRTDYIEAMNILSGGPASRDVLGVPGTLMLEYGTNVTQAVRNESWTQFRSMLFARDVRNFYYFGHGGPGVIGGDYDHYGPTGEVIGAAIAPSGSRAFLDSSWVRDNVTFNKYRGAKYFRLVFFDGCETAKGDWPQAFGMNKATNAIGYYTNPNRQPHTRPSCFVGWNRVVGGTPDWGFTSKSALWRSEWMFQWSFHNKNLTEAFNLARDGSNWIPKQLMDDALRLYGYNVLGFLQYNNRRDWSGP